MKAIVLDSFGSVDELKVRELSIPTVEENEVLIKLDYAGIGSWDAFEREGGYDEMLVMNSNFPYILGSEGSGTVYGKGDKVRDLEVGDTVYATGFLNPKGGFYADYVAVGAEKVFKVPQSTSMEQAGVISGVGSTALRGLEDIINLQANESILIFGASGGIGHLAVQIAKNIGANIFAVASDEDGVEMVKSLGIDSVVDGRKDDLVALARDFAPEGFDAALITAGAKSVDALLECVRKGGRVAYPNGIDPIPDDKPHIELKGYNGDPNSDLLQRFNRWLNSGQLSANIDKVYQMEEAIQAHKALDEHYLGKLCFKVSDD
ncbi:NADP-dependent oxidoreductase [Ruoffia tabacinasalis]|uniref:NADP-dependent oxidoreductase n=1 Tax=Ruoffia tabacinasalis TaxID=87458 RepID=A0A5R9DY69_9LACT|nr:NADP-dependent oxidoreductase [Ruoffia tabacinasalis]TLQ41750.1 NADP-dependent oxidoreductase [Ruoffia tabacinasalis]